MSKIITASVAAAFLSLAAETSLAAVFPFSLASLTGPYVFQVHGFELNDGTHAGEIAALGLLTFDGAGHVSGNVIFTSADSGGDQANCTGVLSTASSYTVNAAQGTGTLTLAFTATSACVVPVTPPSEATIVFNFALNNGGLTPQQSAATRSGSATSASLLLTNFTPGPTLTTIAGELISSLALQGGLRRQPSID